MSCHEPSDVASGRGFWDDGNTHLAMGESKALDKMPHSMQRQRGGLRKRSFENVDAGRRHSDSFPRKDKGTFWGFQWSTGLP